MSVEEYEKLDEGGKKYIDKVAYLSAASHRYIYPPENDPALYTDHRELTKNYLEFESEEDLRRRGIPLQD